MTPTDHPISTHAPQNHKNIRVPAEAQRLRIRSGARFGQKGWRGNFEVGRLDDDASLGASIFDEFTRYCCTAVYIRSKHDIHSPYILYIVFFSGDLFKFPRWWWPFFGVVFQSPLICCRQRLDLTMSYDPTRGHRLTKSESSK